MVHFSTTEAQRREAFVAQRLREEFLTTSGNINGHIPPEEWSVDEWLSSQRRARKPDQGPWGWEGYAELTTWVSEGIGELVDKGEFDVTVLADPSPRSQYPRDVPGEQGAGLRTILTTLADAGAKIYMGSERGHDCIILRIAERDVAIDFAQTMGATFFDAFGAHYLSVFIDSWCRGGPQYRKAREFLCNILAVEVKRVREEAELDFDMAVAVSEDGKRILSADRVFVFDAGTWLHFSPSVFFADKIAISQKYRRSPLNRRLEGSNKSLLASLIGEMREKPKKAGYPFSVGNFRGWEWSDQVLFIHKDSGGRKQRFLVTTSDLLATPMPEGGTIISK